MNPFSLLGLLAFASLPALSCVCVSAAGSTAKTIASEYSVVFRGTVTEREVLAQWAEMKGRRRYKITFHVDEYWKGSPGRVLVLYGQDYVQTVMETLATKSGKAISFMRRKQKPRMSSWKMACFGLAGQMCFPRARTC